MIVIFVKKKQLNKYYSLRENCPYLKLFWSVSIRILSKYGKMRTRIAPNMNTFYAVTTLYIFNVFVKVSHNFVYL